MSQDNLVQITVWGRKNIPLTRSLGPGLSICICWTTPLQSKYCTRDWQKHESQGPESVHHELWSQPSLLPWTAVPDVLEERSLSKPTSCAKPHAHASQPLKFYCLRQQGILKLWSSPRIRNEWLSRVNFSILGNRQMKVNMLVVMKPKITAEDGERLTVHSLPVQASRVIKLGQKKSLAAQIKAGVSSGNM